MKIRMETVFAGLVALAVWSDGPTDEAPVPEPSPTEVAPRKKAPLPRVEVGSTGVIVLPLTVLKHQFWQPPPVAGTPNREWRVGDDEYNFPWVEHGDRLTILADPGDDSDPARLVSARMETGRFAGRTYKLERSSIAAAQ